MSYTYLHIFLSVLDFLKYPVWKIDILLVIHHYKLTGPLSCIVYEFALFPYILTYPQSNEVVNVYDKKHSRTPLSHIILTILNVFFLYIWYFYYNCFSTMRLAHLVMCDQYFYVNINSDNSWKKEY